MQGALYDSDAPYSDGQVSSCHAWQGHQDDKRCTDPRKRQRKELVAKQEPLEQHGLPGVGQGVFGKLSRVDTGDSRHIGRMGTWETTATRVRTDRGHQGQQPQRSEHGSMQQPSQSIRTEQVSSMPGPERTARKMLGTGAGPGSPCPGPNALRERCWAQG